MGRRQRLRAARLALAAVRAGGGQIEESLAAIEVLRDRDREIYQGCERLVRAGNPERALRLLDELGAGGPLAPGGGDAAPDAPSPLRRRAVIAAWSSWIVWLGLALFLWLAPVPLGLAIPLLALAWAVTVAALRAGGALVKQAYAEYSGLGHLGALVFLAVPLMTPLGLVWTLARAMRVATGKVIGQGHDPHPGGGWQRFDVGWVGTAGRPVASALVSIAVGHVAAVAALVVRSGVLDHLHVS